MIEPIIKSFLESIREDIIAEQKKLGIKASGKSADSMRIEADESSGKLYGSKAIRFQVLGRGPGKFPPPQTIKDWINQKPIPVVGITVDSLAYLIGRKISLEGTDIYQGKRPGLPLNDIIERNTKPFIERMAKEVTVDVFNKIKAA